MPDEHKTVFISYRRSVAAGYARAVFMDLCANGYDVFMDVESIDSGHFDQIILNQIEARAHFVLILAPGTVERCINADDWLRREIEYAIDKQRNIVPLFVSGFNFTGAESYLTGKLSTLPTFNGLNVPVDYFDEAMERLRARFLKQPVYGEVKPAPVHEQSAIQKKIDQATAQPAPSMQQLSAEDYFNRAFQKDHSGDYGGAVADYSEAIRLNADYTLAYSNRAIVRYYMGDYDNAIADYDAAIRLDPNSGKLYALRGFVRASQGDSAGAIADQTEALQRAPQYISAYKYRAAAREASGDLRGALSDYQQYLDADGGKRDGNQAEMEQKVKDLRQRLK